MPRPTNVTSVPGPVPGTSGLTLSPVFHTRPARERFPAGPEGDAQFEAHLDALGARIRAHAPKREAKRRLPAKPAPNAHFTIAGRRIEWLDLKTLQCAGCLKTLLGPSMEPLRAAAHPRTRSRLPPRVAGHRAGRPVCARCLRSPEVGLALSAPCGKGGAPCHAA